MHSITTLVSFPAALAVLLAAAAPAQTIVRSHPGTTAGSRYGSTVAGAGDVDMDGHDDVVIGAPLALANRGTVEVRSGRTGALLLSATGGPNFDRLGGAVAGAGDVNGDGRDDIVVGAPNAFPFAVAPGYAIVLSGATGAQLHRFDGTTNGDQFGAAVAGVGDVDDDGYDDVAVGRWGGVVVYSGRSGTALHTVQSGGGLDRFGAAVARVGDFDGDGIEDFAVGAPNADASGSSAGRGRVTVFSGRTAAVLLVRNGDSLGDAFGTAVAGGFDVTGDGVPDFVVGAPDDDNNGTSSGSIRLFAGGSGVTVWTRDGAGFDRLGLSVALVGDMDGDGRSEVAAGAPQPPVIMPTLPGYVRVWSSAGAVLFTAHGDSVGDEMGTAVASAGDVDRNGLADLVAGAPLDDPAGSDSGLARIYRRSSRTDPGRFEDYGRGCPGADGRLPRLAFAGRASIGHGYSVRVRSAPPSAPGILRVAFGRNELELTFLGAPSCMLLTQFFLDLPIGTNPAGRASVPLTIPPNPATVGLVVDFQWSIVSVGANALGIITSDGGELTIGQG